MNNNNEYKRLMMAAKFNMHLYDKFTKIKHIHNAIRYINRAIKSYKK
jgi:hypothetical protein